MKDKKCKVCREVFTPVRQLQSVCGIECAKTLAETYRLKKDKENKRKERKEFAKKRDALRPLSFFKAKAQTAINALRREIDKNLPCISCGTTTADEWHAGHYVSRGSAPELALEIKNIHKQCNKCNIHLHGNLINFRKGLLSRYGVEYVEWLEGPHDPKHYKKDDYLLIESDSKSKLRALYGKT